MIVPGRAHRLRPHRARGQGARRRPRPDGAGDPVREGRRRRRRAGQDRSAGQPLAGGHPRRDRGGAGATPAGSSTTPPPRRARIPEPGRCSRTGQTMGVFYTESPASRQLCIKSKAEGFELLVLNTSIIRPASNRFIRIYLERLHGGAVRAARSLPARRALRDLRRDGLPGRRGERERRRSPGCRSPPATGSARRSPRSAGQGARGVRGGFLRRGAALGRTVETAKKVWEMVMCFAGYSFCKGHSCSYIQVAQQSLLPPGPLPGGILRGRAGQRRRVLRPVRLCGGGQAGGDHGAAAGRERERGPDDGARGGEIRIGLQFVKGLSAEGDGERVRSGGRSDESEPGLIATFTTCGGTVRVSRRRPAHADQGRARAIPSRTD